ncbi:MAG: ComF family protein [bacterium]
MIVKKFKYTNRREIGMFIAAMMHEKLMTEQEFSDIEYITYIPFSYFKKFNRFYNHSMILAENLSELTGVPLAGDIISQRFLSLPQAKLPTELRRKRPSMFLGGKRRVKAGKILLIDDVLTTGRTISDASDALKKHNDIERVVALTFSC